MHRLSQLQGMLGVLLAASGVVLVTGHLGYGLIVLGAALILGAAMESR